MGANAGSNVGSLGDLQRAFQDYLLANSDSFQAAVRDTRKADRITLLDVYRDGYALRLIEVLTSDYPGLMAMAGPADFDHMARSFCGIVYSPLYNSNSSDRACARSRPPAARSCRIRRAWRTIQSLGCTCARTRLASVAVAMSNGPDGLGSPYVTLNIRPEVRCTPSFSWHSPTSVQSAM